MISVDVYGDDRNSISRLVQHAQENWQTFLQTYDVQALKHSVESMRRVLRLRDRATREWADSAADLAQALSALFRHTANRNLLEELIQVGDEVLEIAFPEDYIYRETQLALSVAHLAIYNQIHDRKRIDIAVSLCSEALSLAIAAESERLDEYYLRLGVMYLERFEGEGDDEDLNNGIESLRLAVTHSRTSAASLSGRLADLGKALLMRYERWGREADAEEATAVYVRALESVPPDHPEHASHLSGLGGVLQEQYSLRGRLADLDSGIDYLRRASEETPDGHPDRLIRSGRLATALLQRFARSQDHGELDEAIQLLEGALSEETLDHSAKRPARGALADALQSRAMTSSRDPIRDLRRAEQLLIAALLEANPASSENRAIRSDAARVQGTLYVLTGANELADGAIRDLYRVVADSPSDSPAHASRLKTLAELLLVRVETEPLAPTSKDLLEQARVAAERAANHRAASPLVACTSAIVWAAASDGSERLSAYERAFDVLPLMVPNELEVADSIFRLQTVSELASAAAAAYIEIGNVPRAVELLEQGRAVSLNSRLRWSEDVARLGLEEPDLAQQYLRLTTSRSAIPDTPAAGVNRENELRVLLAKIRRVSGLESFARPRTYAELTADLPGGTVCYLNVSAMRCDAILIDQAGQRILQLEELDEQQAHSEADRFRLAIAAALESDDDAEIALSDGAARDVMAWLWDAAIGKVLAALGYGARAETPSESWPRIWWIPTGALALLPIHAAGHHSEVGVEPVATGATTIDRVISSVLPSLEVLRRARRSASHDEPVSGQGLVIAARKVDGEMELPGVVEEVHQISSWVERGSITLLSDALELAPDGEPTPDAVLHHMRSARWVHFACHGGVDSFEPTRSELLLCGGPGAALRVEDLLVNEPGTGRLAYFSACSTAQISPTQTSEPVHFGIAATLMGFAHVIMTLWPIFDDPEVAGTVYSVVTNQGISLDESRSAYAVHAATHELRARHRGGIYAWAAYVHQGA